jgi:hypothetical protein
MEYILNLPLLFPHTHACLRSVLNMLGVDFMVP